VIRQLHLPAVIIWAPKLSTQIPEHHFRTAFGVAFNARSAEGFAIFNLLGINICQSPLLVSRRAAATSAAPSWNRFHVAMFLEFVHNLLEIGDVVLLKSRL
jgi:hypothetical protein